MDKSVNEHKVSSELEKKSICLLGCSQVQHNLYVMYMVWAQTAQMEHSKLMFKYLWIVVTLVQEVKPTDPRKAQNLINWVLEGKISTHLDGYQWNVRIPGSIPCLHR